MQLLVHSSYCKLYCFRNFILNRKESARSFYEWLLQYKEQFHMYCLTRPVTCYYYSIFNTTKTKCYLLTESLISNLYRKLQLSRSGFHVTVTFGWSTSFSLTEIHGEAIRKISIAQGNFNYGIVQRLCHNITLTDSIVYN